MKQDPTSVGLWMWQSTSAFILALPAPLDQHGNKDGCIIDIWQDNRGSQQRVRAHLSMNEVEQLISSLQIMLS